MEEEKDISEAESFLESNNIEPVVISGKDKNFSLPHLLDAYAQKYFSKRTKTDMPKNVNERHATLLVLSQRWLSDEKKSALCKDLLERIPKELQRHIVKNSETYKELKDESNKYIRELNEWRQIGKSHNDRYQKILNLK